VPDYGPVWIPNDVPVEWAPYHYGHWVWIAPWGWTWVDNDAWGWAPFHYGRWVLVGAHWGWVPGPRVVRPVWAPAMVGFVGGRGWSVSITFGGVGGVAWFPLGPRDVYVPSYHCSQRYVQYVNVTNTRVVNVTHVTNVYNTVIVNRQNYHYTYENNTRAVVAVSRETFVNARPVRSNAIRVNEQQLRNVRVVENDRITPTRASFVAATRVSTARPNVPFARRPVTVNLPPPKRTGRTVYTNDNAPFNQPRDRGNPNEARGGQLGQAQRQPQQGQPGQPNQGSRPGFHPFTPPLQQRAGGSAPPNQGASQPNRPEQNPRNDNINRDNVNRPNDNFDRNNNRPNENPNRPNENPNFNRPNENPNNGRPNENPNRPNDNFDRNNNRPNENPNRPNGNPSRPNDNFNRNNNPPNENVNRPANAQPAYQPPPQPQVRYAPPVRARDQNYDVHPPRNNSRVNTAPRQGGGGGRPSPPPKSEPKPQSKPPKGNGRGR
ncbi:MAG TPA: DUF6600 domain-containing protein, partial [Candidatus Acidoferrales bacterium]|nr:DUF6600 domain-containing protein [Candidatus Acidoferrales bacterium]